MVYSNLAFNADKRRSIIVTKLISIPKKDDTVKYSFTKVVKTKNEKKETF